MALHLTCTVGAALIPCAGADNTPHSPSVTAISGTGVARR